MASQGVATVDFGAFPGGPEASITVTGQTGILSTSQVEAWVRCEPAGTTDHSMDEHFVENLEVRAGNINPGVGFDIRVYCTLGTTYGQFSINWVWA
jgi:hypothetical protein